MADCNSRHTPHVEGCKYQGPSAFDSRSPKRQTQHQSFLGELRYIADCSRTDIAFYVNRASAAAHDRADRHWLLLKNLLRYLQTPHADGIVYHPYNPTKGYGAPAPILAAYCGASFASHTSNRKSISGHIHLYHGSPIALTSAKQTMLALSTCEAEYVSATDAVQMTPWFRRILKWLHYLPPSPSPMHIDKQSAIRMASNTAPTKRGKAIDIKYYYLRLHFQAKHVKPIHTPSQDMLADICRKLLARIAFNRLRQAINVV